MRLDWLWHLEYVTNLMQWHEAAHTVQAAWRGRRDPRLLAHNRQQKLNGASGKGAAASASAATGGKAAASNSSGSSNSTNTTATSVPSPPPANTDGDDATAPADAPTASAGSDEEPLSKDTEAERAPPAKGRRGVMFDPERKTVFWKEELAEVRHYAVVQPAQPRWS